MLVILLFAYTLAYDGAQIVRECEGRHLSDPMSANECSIRELASLSEQQMSVEQYLYIAQRITEGPCKASCNLLVFGVGGDSPLWISANRNGRTLFLEESAKWAKLARERTPDIEVELVKYRTRLRDLSRQADDINSQFHIIGAHQRTRWDVILIDAPTGHAPDTPGRLQAVWFTARNVVRHDQYAEVFIHDYERKGERFMGRSFFSFPFATHPLVISSPTRNQRLAHWKLRRDRDSLARGLARARLQHGFAVVSVVSSPQRGRDSQERQCLLDMQARSQESAVSRGLDPSDYVLVRFESDEDGIEFDPPMGKYTDTYQFASATLLKTKVVLSALRLGFAVLLADVDVWFTRLFSPGEIATFAKSASASRQRFVFQRECNMDCTFQVNTGFYLALPSTHAAATLSAVWETAKIGRVTEQQAWTYRERKEYQGLFDAECKDPLDFFVNDGERPLRLLAAREWANGLVLNRTRGVGAKIVHFNYVVGMCNKLELMRNFVIRDNEV